MKNRKEDVIFIAVLLFLILVFVLLRVFRGEKVEAPIDDVVPVVSENTVNEVEKPIIVKKKKPAVVWPERSYSEEFMIHKDGRLIQFNQSCSALPASLVIPNGASIMLDNRSDVSQVITLGENKYTLPAYEFEVFNVSVPKIPTEYTLNCNNKPNVATLSVN